MYVLYFSQFNGSRLVVGINVTLQERKFGIFEVLKFMKIVKKLQVVLMALTSLVSCRIVQSGNRSICISVSFAITLSTSSLH